jgi:acid stress-induced BolA-like protein IbaG/YrbA
MSDISDQHPLAQSIKQHISTHLSCDSIQVMGDGQHFYATIISADFTGKSRIARHQLVYQALGERMRHEIHALSIKTFTPEESATKT